jgi:hypothetical protein
MVEAAAGAAIGSFSCNRRENPQRDLRNLWPMTLADGVRCRHATRAAFFPIRARLARK